LMHATIVAGHTGLPWEPISPLATAEVYHYARSWV
jgi:hypothetical protein